MSFAPAYLAPAATIAGFGFLTSDPQSSDVTLAFITPIVVASTDLSTFLAPRGILGVRLDSFGGSGLRAAGSVEEIAEGSSALPQAWIDAGGARIASFSGETGFCRCLVRLTTPRADGALARRSLKKNCHVSSGCSLAGPLSSPTGPSMGLHRAACGLQFGCGPHVVRERSTPRVPLERRCNPQQARGRCSL